MSLFYAQNHCDESEHRIFNYRQIGWFVWQKSDMWERKSDSVCRWQSITHIGSMALRENWMNVCMFFLCWLHVKSATQIQIQAINPNRLEAIAEWVRSSITLIAFASRVVLHPLFRIEFNMVATINSNFTCMYIFQEQLEWDSLSFCRSGQQKKNI